jgi:hypothetical protein
VSHVPLENEPPQLLERAGFVGMRLLKLDAKPCFVRGEAALRELQLEGWKPDGARGAAQAALYKGPFRQVTDDAGRVYPRGQRVPVTAEDAARLERAGAAEQFLLL